MKKCNRLMDYLESEGPDISPEILKHAAGCSDCSLDLKNREDLLLSLRDASEPEIPAGLHSFIMQGVEAGKAEENSENTIFDNLFEKIWPSLEFGATAACLIMVAFLFNLSPENSRVASIKKRKPVTFKIADKIPVKSETKDLEKVSSEDVKIFMEKLKKYRQQHPEMRRKESYKILPEIELVKD